MSYVSMADTHKKLEGILVDRLNDIVKLSYGLKYSEFPSVSDEKVVHFEFTDYVVKVRTEYEDKYEPAVYKSYKEIPHCLLDATDEEVCEALTLLYRVEAMQDVQQKLELLLVEREGLDEILQEINDDINNQR